MMSPLTLYFVIVSTVAFLVFGVDKLYAKVARGRIPERVLLFLIFIGGSIGALTGMYLFHHKINKPKFLRKALAVLIVQFGLMMFLAWLW